jgi:hypothetical protein
MNEIICIWLRQMNSNLSLRDVMTGKAFIIQIKKGSAAFAASLNLKRALGVISHIPAKILLIF